MGIKTANTLILSERTPPKRRKKLSYEDICELLPSDAYWGDPISSTLIRKIINKYNERK